MQDKKIYHHLSYILKYFSLMVLQLFVNHQVENDCMLHRYQIIETNFFSFNLSNTCRSQSSLDSANGFALVAHDLNKDLEQKSMREYRNDVNVIQQNYCLSDCINIFLFFMDRYMNDYMIFSLTNMYLIILYVKYGQIFRRKLILIYFYVYKNQECTDTLLDKLDVDLQMATHELSSYK